MVIITGKEIGNDMRPDKPALFIERNSRRTVTCSNLQDRILLSECPDDKSNHLFRIAFSLVFRYCSKIFDFKHTVSFIRDDALAFDAVVIENKHPAVMEIAINHIFLLVCQ